MSKYTLYDYDSSEFQFKETVQSMMDVDQLDMIHEVFEFPEKFLPPTKCCIVFMK